MEQHVRERSPVQHLCAVGFSILEGLKIRLYGRLLTSLRDVQLLFDEADQRRQAKQAAA